MWALDAGGDPSLLQKALGQSRLASQFGVEELECDRSPEHFVTRLVHGSHAAVADEANDPILPSDYVVRLRAHEPTYGSPS